jgi:hypothetical protein
VGKVRGVSKNDFFCYRWQQGLGHRDISFFLFWISLSLFWILFLFTFIFVNIFIFEKGNDSYNHNNISQIPTT